LAFSWRQRDKVYAQHLMRKRRAQLWRWLRDGGQLCACEIAAQHGNLDPNAAKGRLEQRAATLVASLGKFE
jgi:hypothetical protein